MVRRASTIRLRSLKTFALATWANAAPEKISSAINAIQLVTDVPSGPRTRCTYHIRAAPHNRFLAAQMSSIWLPRCAKPFSSRQRCPDGSLAIHRGAARWSEIRGFSAYRLHSRVCACYVFLNRLASEAASPTDTLGVLEPDIMQQLLTEETPGIRPENLIEDTLTGDAGGRIYTDGEYLAHNPTWHTEDSPWKADQILDILHRNQLTPKSVCEVGCGAGEILVQLKRQMPDDCQFCGYDISPQALALARSRADERLCFRLGEMTEQHDVNFDMILVVDLLEHLEDYFQFLRLLRPRAVHKVFHIPLDLSAYSVLRSHPILDLRASVGHIHYFTRDTALASLEDAGYEVLDSFYTPNDESLKGRPWKQKALALFRRGLSGINADLSARLLGGRSLLVLAR